MGGPRISNAQMDIARRELTPDRISKLRADGLSYTEIGDLYGISSSAVYRWHDSVDTAEICPYCKNRFTRLCVHLESCALHPKCAERIREFLYQHSADGILMSFTAYKKKCIGLDIPGVSKMMTTFGSWGEVGKHFDLQPPRKYKQAVPARCRYIDTELWSALAVWFRENDAPYYAKDWDDYAADRPNLPRVSGILKWFNLAWEDVVDTYTTRRLPLVDEAHEAEIYRAPLKITTAMKDAAEAAVAHIQNEVQRAREYLSLLGYSDLSAYGMGDD